MDDVPATGLPPRDPDDPHDRAALASTVFTRVPVNARDRSSNARVCPFLRAIDDDDVLGFPVESPDPANRCAALREAVPQSLRQHELVCLTSGHVNCPRFMRGSMGPNQPVERVTATRTVTPATAGALAIFALAFLVSIAFVVANGGLALTTAAASPSASGGVLAEVDAPSPTPPPTAAATPSTTAIPTPPPSPSPSPTPTASPSPTPLPTPTPTATPVRTAKPTARPASSRLALLKPCPDQPRCYLYAIRSGDNLYSIANYFGVSFATVKSLNPWTQNGLTIGRQLRLPPPTR